MDKASTERLQTLLATAGPGELVQMYRRHGIDPQKSVEAVSEKAGGVCSPGPAVRIQQFRKQISPDQRRLS